MFSNICGIIINIVPMWVVRSESGVYINRAIRLLFFKHFSNINLELKPSQTPRSTRIPFSILFISLKNLSAVVSPYSSDDKLNLSI